MKKPYLKTKSHVIKSSFILLVVFSIIVIHSCRKDLKTSESASEQVLKKNGINLVLLQKNYNKGIAKTKLKVTDISQQTLANIINSLNVDWTSYTISTYPDSTQVIEFSMPDDTTIISPSIPAVGDSIKYFTKTSAVFILRNDTVNTSFFMKTVEDCTAPGYQSVINYVHYQQIPGSFTGNVYYFTLNRDFLNGWRWQNGNLTGTIAFGNIISQANNNIGHVQPAEVDPCIETTYTIYLQTYVNGVAGATEDLFSYSVISCPDGAGSSSAPTGSGTTSSSGGGASGAPSIPTQTPCNAASSAATVQSIKGRVIDVASGGTGTGSGSSGSSSNPCTTVKTQITPAIKDIKDSVTNPCLRNLITQITNDNQLQTTVTSMLRNTFGVNDQVNLTFYQATLTGQYTNAVAQTTGNQLNNLTTTFNTPQIANASQEYLLETTLHEIFHAYLYVNTGVRGILTQHAYMIQNYINTEVQTLQQVFPSLSTHDAECLALGGYGELDPTTLNAAIASYGLSISDVASTNASYKAGSSGTKC